MEIINIWVNGCFDVLHIGHIELLKYAKSLGNNLIVGIDSDDRIKLSKGSDRPFNNQSDRKLFLESIKYVDKVVIYNSNEQLEQLLLNNKINKIVIGSDWYGKKIVGDKIVKEIDFFQRIGNYSTTNILNYHK